MSRLAGRLSKLEREFGGCPACKERPAEIIVRGPADQGAPAKQPQLCEQCGEPFRQLTVLLAYDPDAPVAREP